MHTALVTGASRGIGQAIATRLRADGIAVFAPTRAEMDLESPESIEEYLVSLSSDVDILINDAGINRIAELEDIKATDLHATLQINLLAPFLLSRALAARMCTKGYGRIVNISSIWSLVSRPGRTSYSMSKSALNGMTRSMAVELAPFNVLVNAIAPGYVLTDLTRQNNPPDQLEKIRKSIPIQRIAEPDEIAQLVAFLCSEHNSYITGQTIAIDGGYSCQ
jgi:NAD(P)-dependent dehydrogenase (short-subunit alcohol dehydrogenase family)